MATFLNDTFTEAAGGSDINLETHTGETGATWTLKTASAFFKIDKALDRVYTPNNDSVYYASGVPAGADYYVEAVMIPNALTSGHYIGVVGRLTTTLPDNYYSMEYSVTNGRWELWKATGAGPTYTMLTSYTQTLTADASYTMKLQMIGTAIKGFVDTVERMSSTDSAITAAGRAGLDGLGTINAGSSLNLDSITAADEAGSGTGTFPVAPTRLIQHTVHRM